MSPQFSEKQQLEQLTLALAQLQQENDQLREQLSRQHSETEEAIAEALNASRAKSDFLAMMSHEIRTPMNAILGYTQLLLKASLESRLQQYVQRIHTSGEGLLQIINDILDFSKIEAGKLALEYITFQPDELFQQLNALFQQQAKPKGVQLSFTLDSDVPRRLEGDPLRIRQIITNLVSNALKFTEKGQITVHGRLRYLRAQECLIEIECADTGIGISPAVQKRLFTPFTQADSSTTRQYGGTGLGLSICRRLAGMMGGDIQLHSEVGQGSRFVVSLLLKRADGESVMADSLAPGNQDEQRFAGARLLLVEDNELNQELVCEMLSDTGLNIDVAGNGLEALEKLKVNTYDVVLMDMQMPLIDGLETTRRLRRDLLLTSLPVLALTANATLEDRTACLAVGMNDFLSKPVAASALLNTLDQWLLAPDASVTSTEITGSGDNVLNIDHALELMGGKTALLHKMLNMFKDRYADSVDTMRLLVQQQQWEELQRLAHTLRGVSANIAADDLSAAAAMIENTIKRHPDAPQVQDLVDTYAIHLQQLMGSIDKFLSTQ